MTSIAAYNGGLVLSGPDGSLRVSFFRFYKFLGLINGDDKSRPLLLSSV